MRSIKFVLCGAGISLVGAFIVAGCSASGDPETDSLESAESEIDAGEDAGSSNVVPANDASPGTDSPTDAGTDAGKKPGKDAGTDAGGDSGKDASSSPLPGTTCTAQDEIVSRTCGKCGQQETICQSGDKGLAWSEYGPCGGEQGACLPGDTQPCGNCGVRTCTDTCGWGACAGQPANSCAPGSVDFTTAGCPTSGFKARTCSAACQWGTFSTVCDMPRAVKLWAGTESYSTFMLGNDGALYAWGLDADGQLGDGDTTNKGKITPTPFSNVTSLQVGGGTTYGFTCASFGDGTGKCWGYNSTSYTLGDGVTSTSPTAIIPTGFDADIAQMVAGYAHGCGLFADGSAKCWGYNLYGQLGNGTTTTSKTPVAVNLTDITRLYAGYYTTCALKGDAAYCWGYNTYGTVGDGTTTSKSTPTSVIASDVASLSAGYYHTCAVMTDGTAKCWGQNTSGEIGDGTGGTGAANVTTPRSVVGIGGTGTLSGVAEICTGYGTTCARLSDGRVACWGKNADGQLGVGDPSVTLSNQPKVVSGITSATALACGYKHACAVESDGAVKCWGDNAYGEIGNNAIPTDATSAQTATF